MRAPALLIVACLAAVATGCGGDDGERAQRALVPVELDVGAPADMATVQERHRRGAGDGGARRGANVRVLGVSGGT